MKKQLNFPYVLLSSSYPFSFDEIELVRMKKGRGVWKVKTNQGTMYFKKVPRKETEVKFILAAVDYMRKKGIHFPKIYRANNGEMFVKNGDDCFLLMEEIQGFIPNYKSDDQIETVVKELAKLHRLSIGFNKSKESNAWNKMDKWVRILEKNNSFIESFFKERSSLLKKGLSRSEFKRMEICKTRIESQGFTEENSPYLKWADQNKQNGGLCHYDYNRWNLRLTPSGELYLLDFDTLAVDLPVTDLQNFLFNFLKIEGESGSKIFYQMLYWYQTVNPLSSEEWSIFKEWLRYPHHVVALCKRFESNKKSRNLEETFIKELRVLLQVEILLEKILVDFEQNRQELFDGK